MKIVIGGPFLATIPFSHAIGGNRRPKISPLRSGRFRQPASRVQEENGPSSQRHGHEQVPGTVHRGGEHGEIALRRPVRDMARGVEGRSVPLAVEGAIGLRLERDFPVRADRREREQFPALANDEKSHVTEKVNQALTGEPGQFTISNGWVGSDPLPYHGKSLAVLYSYRGERYVFGAKEDSLVSLGTMMDTSSPAGAPLTHRGGRISGDDGDLVLVAAVYGSENGFGDATQEVAQSLKGGPPFFRATNAWFQHDPNPGWDKSLIIIYHYRNHRALFATTENGKVSYARLVLEAREAVAP